MKKHIFVLWLVYAFNSFLSPPTSFAQVTFPVNGIANPTENAYAFTNATIVKDASTTLTNATLLIRDKKIIAVGNNVTIPKGYVIIDCAGKYIYPSFIDLFSDYGIAAAQKNTPRFNPFSGYQLTSDTKGAVGWNQAIKPEVNAFELFDANNKDAQTWRDAGFGSVLTHQKDGIARGTGTFVTLANQPTVRTHFLFVLSQIPSLINISKAVYSFL